MHSLAALRVPRSGAFVVGMSRQDFCLPQALTGLCEALLTVWY